MDENVPLLVFGSVCIVLTIIGTTWFTHAWARSVALSAAVCLSLIFVLIMGIAVGAGIQDFVEGGFND